MHAGRPPPSSPAPASATPGSSATLDAMALHMIERPQRFDVVVCENLLGDILSDLGAGIIGGLGIAPSAELGDGRGYFQGSHGSAPDIAGQGIANPVGQIWSGAMMLDHLGEPEAAAAIVRAIEKVLGDPAAPKTGDLGGTAKTEDLGRAIAAAI